MDSLKVERWQTDLDKFQKRAGELGADVSIETAEGDDELPAVFDVGDDYRKVLHALRLVLHARYGPPSELQHIPIPDPERLVS